MRPDRAFDLRRLIGFVSDVDLLGERRKAPRESLCFVGDRGRGRARPQANDGVVEAVVRPQSAREGRCEEQLRVCVVRRHGDRVVARRDDADDAQIDAARWALAGAVLRRQCEGKRAPRAEVRRRGHTHVGDRFVRVVGPEHAAGYEFRPVDRTGVPVAGRDHRERDWSALLVDGVEERNAGDRLDARNSRQRGVVAARVWRHEQIGCPRCPQIARVGAVGSPRAGCRQQHRATRDPDQQRQGNPRPRAGAQLRDQSEANRRHVTILNPWRPARPPTCTPGSGDASTPLAISAAGRGIRSTAAQGRLRPRRAVGR